MANNRALRRTGWIGVPVLVLVLIVVFWSWDWFIPLVEARASAAIGRTVTIAHLHVRLGRTVQVAADDVVVGNPADWPAADPPLASVKTLTIQADAWGYVQGHGLVIPLIGLDTPKVYAAETAKGASNFAISTGGGGGGPSPKIGDLQISDGDVHVVIPNLKSDFSASVATQGEGPDAKIEVKARGTYAAQPIEARLVGGALLSLRDAAHPWPVDLSLENGPTRVALNGTLQDPLAFKGADVTLKFSGPNMALLEPLVGFPIPKTPAYDIAGKLDLQGFSVIRFRDFRGRMGNSDVEGTIEEQPSGTESHGRAKPVVTLDLRSNRVDLADLAGFIGGTPGRATTANATAQERAAVQRSNAGPRLLPDTPISIPKMDWANIHLRYHGAHIEGRSIPLDDLTVALDVDNGRIDIHPVSFGIGKGKLYANIDLTPETEKNVRMKLDLHLQNVDVARLMSATHTFQGAGAISGIGAIDSTGNSLATLLANGNGEVKMAMAGGDLSSLLVDLTGLEFGEALLSALGVPSKTPVQCFVGDLGLTRGVLDFKAMELQTGEALTNVSGDVNLGRETIDLSLKTDSRHFSVGSLPARINITGTFKDPSIRPGAAAVARAGATVGLAVLFAPLAILPTIQFGTSEAEDERCGELLARARASAGGKVLPAPK